MTPAQRALGGPVEDSIGILLAPIPAGEFQMGSPDTDKASFEYEKPQHLVKITQPFLLSVCEITQRQYEKVMGSRPWHGQRYAWEGPGLPATYISHDDAVEFCRTLSEKEGMEYRLPTEAEWEYACRAGTTTAFSFGDDVSRLDEHAWCYGYSDRSKGKPHQVGQKNPNPWGLYDMHGNVEEWCHDWYALKYGSEPVSDPTGPPEGKDLPRFDIAKDEIVWGPTRVVRGGSFVRFLDPVCLRSAFRIGYFPGHRRSTFGFRVVRAYGEPTRDAR